MTPKILLRIAAILLLLFAAGHTTGHLGRKKTTDPKGQEVIHAMENYHFDFKGTDQTFDGHMEGYGITITFILIALAMLLWIVSSNTQKDPAYSQKILLPVLVFMIGNGYVAFRYFFLGPGILSVVVCLLLLVTMTLLRNRKSVSV